MAANSGSERAGLARDYSELAKASNDILAREMRKAVKGTGGYRTRWPRQRKQRGKPRRNKPSRLTFRIQSQRRGGRLVLRVRNLQHHGVLLETAETIRGYRNVHHEAALETFADNWGEMVEVALRDAPARVRANRIRSVKARHAAARRTAGYSELWGR